MRRERKNNKTYFLFLFPFQQLETFFSILVPHKLLSDMQKFSLRPQIIFEFLLSSTGWKKVRSLKLLIVFFYYPSSTSCSTVFLCKLKNSLSCKTNYVALPKSVNTTCTSRSLILTKAHATFSWSNLFIHRRNFKFSFSLLSYNQPLGKPFSHVFFSWLVTSCPRKHGRNITTVKSLFLRQHKKLSFLALTILFDLFLFGKHLQFLAALIFLHQWFLI